MSEKRMRDGIGASPKRLEDLRFLKGLGAYVDDLSRPGMLFAAIVRSPHAHARIVRVDAAAAARTDGFVRCITAADVGPMTPIPVRIGASPAFVPHLQRPLASERARYVGEPVSVVLAETPRAAEDAADLVEVEYETLPAVVDVQAARAGGKVVARWDVALGDVKTAFAKADLVVREQFTVSRQTAAPIEPRGLLAEFDPGRRTLTMWGPTKVPYFNRGVLGTMLGLAESQIHFIEPDVGGGFGARGEFYPEDFLVPFAAIASGRPVKWIETRREHFLSINHSRGQVWEIGIAARRDGTLLGIDAAVLHDMGAYIRTHGTAVPTLSAAHLSGPYRIKNYRCAVTCVTTNRTPMATMRGPGLFECNLVRERVLDMIARDLGIEAAELRRRNLIRHEEMPYDVGTEIYGIRTLLDSGDFPAMFDKTLNFAKTETGGTAEPAGRLKGFGMAAIAEPSGWGPFESARVEVDPGGTIRVYTGATSQGQGQETTLAQICREVLGMPLADITVIHGDTRLMRFGVGTYASRAAVTAGNAVFKAARIVHERALDLASQYLEASPADLVLEDGRVHIAGVPQRFVTLGELAKLAAPGARHPNVSRAASEEGLSALAYFDVTEETCGFSVHTAEVSVDPATGEVTVDRYVVAADAGRAINPMIVEAQLVGGAVQGISGALREQLVYGDEGQLLTASFMDYSLPRAGDFRRVDALVLEDAPAPSNPLGVKGVGEAGTSGAGAAIANAVAAALRPLGARITDLPLTAERIWRAIELAKEKS